MNILYSFVSDPGTIDPNFLGLVNLEESNFIFALLAGITQFFQTKMIMARNKNKKQKNKKSDQMAQFSSIMQKQMLYFFPIFTVLILLKLPSAIALYWLITALFSIGQQHLIFKPSLPKGEKEKEIIKT